jgi:hypothetical protein
MAGPDRAAAIQRKTQGRAPLYENFCRSIDMYDVGIGHERPGSDFLAAGAEPDIDGHVVAGFQPRGSTFTHWFLRRTV